MLASAPLALTLTPHAVSSAALSLVAPSVPSPQLTLPPPTLPPHLPSSTPCWWPAFLCGASRCSPPLTLPLPSSPSGAALSLAARSAPSLPRSPLCFVAVASPQIRRRRASSPLPRFALLLTLLMLLMHSPTPCVPRCCLVFPVLPCCRAPHPQAHSCRLFCRGPSEETPGRKGELWCETMALDGGSRQHDNETAERAPSASRREPSATPRRWYINRPHASTAASANALTSLCTSWPISSHFEMASGRRW